MRNIVASSITQRQIDAEVGMFIFWTILGVALGFLIVFLFRFVRQSIQDERRIKREAACEAERKAHIERKAQENTKRQIEAAQKHREFLATPEGKAWKKKEDEKAAAERARRERQKKLIIEEARKQAALKKDAKAFYETLDRDTLKSIKSAPKNKRLALLEEELVAARRNGFEYSSKSTSDDAILNTVLLYSVFVASTSGNSYDRSSNYETAHSSGYDHTLSYHSYDSTPSYSSYDSGSSGSSDFSGGFDGGGSF